MSRSPTNQKTTQAKVDEQYPGMTAFASRVFRETPPQRLSEVTQQLHSFLEAANKKGVASTMNWNQESLDSLARKFSPAHDASHSKPENVDSRKRRAADEDTRVPHDSGLPQGRGPSTDLISQRTNPLQTNSTPLLFIRQKKARHTTDRLSSSNSSLQASTNTQRSPRPSPSSGSNGRSLQAHLLGPSRASSIVAKSTVQSREHTKPLDQPLTSHERERGVTPPGRSTINPSLSDSLTTSSNSDAIARRRARFQSQSSREDFTPPPRPASEVAAPIVGYSSVLEKGYRRLTGPPNPAEVRPLPVLESAFQLVWEKYKQNPTDYGYFVSQLKSIRQDLLVQNIITTFTVRTFEHSARAALEHDDLSEFHKCLSQLMELYDEAKEDAWHYNEVEFRSYDIYYRLFLKRWDEIGLLLPKAAARRIPDMPSPSAEAKHEQVYSLDQQKHIHNRAVAAVHAVQTVNLYALGQRSHETLPLEAKLSGRILLRAQLQALEALLSSMRSNDQKISPRDLAVFVGISQKNMKKMLHTWGIQSQGGAGISVSELYPLVQKASTDVGGPVDIKGQL